MPPRAPAPCLHELRPGTKVCLHCRRAEREARAAHRNRILGRIVVCAIGLGVAVAGAKAGLEAYQRGAIPQIPDLMAATTKAIVESLPGPPTATVVSGVAEAVSGPAVADSAAPLAVAAESSTTTAGAAIALSAVASNDSSGLASPMAVPAAAGQAQLSVPAIPASGNAPAAVPPPSVPATPVPAAPATEPMSLAPVVAQGRTELTGGMFAVRSGDTVTVHFDTPEARTRRPEKFEQIVRTTLPQVHGAAAQTLLGSIAPGSLIGAVDLVNELPVRGLHLKGRDGRTISLWPETRPGRDGPLVVAYRAVPSR